MERSRDHSLYKISPQTADGGQVLYKARRAKDLGLKEDWFRDSIAANPELVIGPSRGAGLLDDDDEQWYCWSTEVPVEASDGLSVGTIDALLVAESGRIGIVETKLAFNPERRRSVLVQVLDYAVHLQEMQLDKLDEIPSDVPVLREHVEEHLAEGDFLIIVAGDELDPRVVRLGAALLSDHTVNPWDLAMVELALFETPDKTSNGYLLVPSLRRALIAESRHIVRVIVGEGERPTVRIERAAPPTSPDGPTRRAWTKEEFLERLAANPDLSAEYKRFANQLVSILEQFPSIQPFWGSGSYPSLVLKRNGKGIIEAYPRYGSVGFRPTKFEGARLPSASGPADPLCSAAGRPQCPRSLRSETAP